jgi:large subunit ribosomal protein L3
MKVFYAIKSGQTHSYDKNGKRLMISKMAVDSSAVVQTKNQQKDGYSAVQVSIGSKKKMNKALAGHCKNIKFAPHYLREIKLEKDEQINQDQIKVADIFKVGDLVKVTSISKGKGFAGGMKRWNFKGGPRTHGQSDRPRSIGSIGQGTDPGRVWKGKKMPGRMGNVAISVKNGVIVFMDEQQNEIWITGTIPGPRSALVKITKVGQKKFVGLVNEKTDETKKQTKVNESKEDRQEIKEPARIATQSVAGGEKTNEKKPKIEKEIETKNKQEIKKDEKTEE